MKGEMNSAVVLTLIDFFYNQNYIFAFHFYFEVPF